MLQTYIFEVKPVQCGALDRAIREIAKELNVEIKGTTVN